MISIFCAVRAVFEINMVYGSAYIYLISIVSPYVAEYMNCKGALVRSGLSRGIAYLVVSTLLSALG